MMNLLRHYKRIINRFPILSQAVQAGVLMGLGDVSAQVIVERKSIYENDWRRTANFTLIGLVVVGPTLRVWYGYLDKRIPRDAKMAALKKMALDQFLFAPLFIIVVLSSIAASRGQSLNEIHTRLKKDYEDVLINNYKVWPFVQMCNFYLTPLQYQVLVVQSVSLFWNTYLSWKSNRDG